MPIDRLALTPQQRLATSRRALFHSSSEPAGRVDEDEDALAPLGEAPGAGWLAQLPLLGILRSVGRRWWRRHPANAVVHLAEPALARFAAEQPVKLMAIAAGMGAVIALVKPWRLLSVTAVLAAVLKTSDVADMVTTLMQHNNFPRKDVR